MNTVLEALLPGERQTLAALLQERAPQGAMTLSEADGFFHGVVSLPRLTLPSVWLPEVLGNAEPKDEREAEQVFGLLMRQYNEVARAQLAGDPQPQSDGSARQSAEWLRGLGRALPLDPDAALTLARTERGAQVVGMLLSHAVTADMVGELPPSADRLELLEMREHSLAALRRIAPEENREMLRALASVVHRTLADARERANRRPRHPSEGTFVRSGRKIGPNEPCPCGSGKKYKKCCGKAV